MFCSNEFSLSGSSRFNRFFEFLGDLWIPVLKLTVINVIHRVIPYYCCNFLYFSDARIAPSVIGRCREEVSSRTMNFLSHLTLKTWCFLDVMGKFKKYT